MKELTMPKEIYFEGFVPQAQEEEQEKVVVEKATKKKNKK